MEKIKVALICHFSNAQVRDRLNLSGEKKRFADFGNWISNIINGLKNRDDVELHVIAPHKSMKSATQKFEIDDVHYYFYRVGLPSVLCSIDERLQSRFNFPRNRKYIKSFLTGIKPDLVNLIGAENPYYSAATLDIDGVPIFLHCQTVYANPDRIQNAGNVNLQRWDLEVKLFQKIKYIACTGRMYYDLVKGYAPEAIMFPRVWPPSPFPEVKEVPKKYDFAFFARYLNKNKGFDNAIEAIAEVVKHHPKINVLAVGSWDGDRSFFENRIQELGIEENLHIHPSFPSYVDMLQCVKQAKYALLPIKMDVLSGTILEAMRMGLPVVTCRTSGTPSLNEKRPTILISDIDDNEGLANNMLLLLEDESLVGLLRDNAFQYIKEKDEANTQNTEMMVAQYRAVIDHYRNGAPIPKEMLYNIDENKDYRKQ